jgi:serine/threonine protein phosphatase PrpC
MQDQVMVDLQADEPQPGDIYLLCSDGLSGMIADDEILDILMSTGDINEGCRRLITRANEHGGEDNITAILVRIDDGPAKDSTKPPPRTEGETTARGLPVVSVPAGYGSKPDEAPSSVPASGGRPPFSNGST